MTGHSLGIAIVAFAGALFAFSSCAQDSPPPKLTVPDLHICKEPRPEMCMELYQPVCGVSKDGTQKTYGNSCQACAHAEIVRYTPGKCEKDDQTPR
jgi:hypothetical protein